ncbi:Crp/Fnr family transcriptional regulator [Lignipirellula cremea]|uniref:Global nitrogen regulator n=1 Tax=Lignipirellula cremea TaxID=2528010 RepID=A0A518E1D5_9BACT|nr:Crp/Fnr family transcriptional regulator [Lignipirellula cremea]QDU97905.1 Global nitrogen regulator [Lignipirellula cremea]
MAEQYWQLRCCDLFERISTDALQELERCSRARTFRRRAPIYLPADQGDAVFLLSSGRAKICHVTSEGKQSILSFIEPGELFGELSLFDQGARDEYAEAVEESLVVMIPADAMNRLMESQPQLALGVTKLIGLRRKRIEQRLKNLLFLSNRDRLTHLLLDLAQQYGKPSSAGPGAVALGIKLSHQELANVIGSTRESVTVVLGEMQAEKLIAIGRRQIELLDLKRLAQAVGRPEPAGASPPSVRSAAAPES